MCWPYVRETWLYNTVHWTRTQNVPEKILVQTKLPPYSKRWLQEPPERKSLLIQFLNVYKDPYGNIPRTTTILMQRSGSKKWWDLTPKRTVIEWDIYRNIVLMTGVSRRAITHPRHQGRFGQERNMYRISVVSDTYRNIVLMTGVHHDEPSHDTQQSQVRHTGVTQGRWAMSSSS